MRERVKEKKVGIKKTDKRAISKAQCTREVSTTLKKNYPH